MVKRVGRKKLIHMEFILGFLYEVVFQFIAEIVSDFLFRSFGTDKRGGRILFYSLLGAGAGGLSVYWFPAHLIDDGTGRLIALFLVPTVLGIVMHQIGQWKNRRERDEYGLEALQTLDHSSIGLNPATKRQSPFGCSA